MNSTVRNITTTAIALLVIWLGDLATVRAADKPNFRTIELWPNGAPGATGTSDEDKPAITPFIPDAAKATGAAILVIPGGGFTLRATDHEGVQVAQWLKERGIAAFLLRYRIRPLYSREHWLRDAQRGMQFIRARAAEYRVDVNRVGVIGFSAGAQLAADATFNPLAGEAAASDPLDRVASRPDFLILSYGSMQMPAAAQSAANTKLPPTFMYCTAEDTGQMRGMVDLYASLHKANVPVEAHFFATGVHGVGFAQGDPVLGEWPHLMHRWLTVGGWLTGKTRLALKGVVKLDGAPLVRGVVLLTPVDQPNAPTVVAYITNAHTNALGSFDISPEQGPVAGKYRVEVRQDATRWLSNSRDPLMLKMTAKQRDRTLTDADRREWGDYVRQRDLSPSIENQRVFDRQRLQDKADYIVEIKPGMPELTLAVFSR
ncbi:MAG: alpha/beta hydrolase [Acidobacteria bacterium]|nr:alpha/beta hydrolase [Acidobacteriota bacterium]MBI3426652.1 alpha/beta hydrolase [Acidobacteriota bacterium]